MPELDYRDVLLKAASIVEEGWTQGVSHRDKYDHPCMAEDAVKSCAMGAIERSVIMLSGGDQDLYESALCELSKNVRPDIACWNDSRDKDAGQVAAKFREVASASNNI